MVSEVPRSPGGFEQVWEAERNKTLPNCQVMAKHKKSSRLKSIDYFGVRANGMKHKSPKVTRTSFFIFPKLWKIDAYMPLHSYKLCSLLKLPLKHGFGDPRSPGGFSTDLGGWEEQNSSKWGGGSGEFSIFWCFARLSYATKLSSDFPDGSFFQNYDKSMFSNVSKKMVKKSMLKSLYVLISFDLFWNCLWNMVSEIPRIPRGFEQVWEAERNKTLPNCQVMAKHQKNF